MPFGARQGIKRGAGTARAIAIIPEPDVEMGKVGRVDSGCKPMAGDGIYRSSTCRPGSRMRADLYTAKKMAGRGRGVFAISLACLRRRRIADRRRVLHTQTSWCPGH